MTMQEVVIEQRREGSASAIGRAGSSSCARWAATEAATFVIRPITAISLSGAVASGGDAAACVALERELTVAAQVCAALTVCSPSTNLLVEKYANAVIRARTPLSERRSDAWSHPSSMIIWTAQCLSRLRAKLLESIDLYEDWFAAMRAINPTADRIDTPVRFIEESPDYSLEVLDLDTPVAVEEWLSGE